MNVSLDLKTLREFVSQEVRRIREFLTRPFGLPIFSHKASVKAQWNRVILVDSTNNDVDVYLPTIDGVSIGRIIVVKKVSDDTNTVTIYPVGSDTVDGAASQNFTEARGAMILIASSGNWNEA